MQNQSYLKEKVYNIYTDGSSIKNGDPTSLGSFSYVVTENDEMIYDYSMLCTGVTSNRMELNAVLYSLLWIYNNPNCKAYIHSDSQYVVKCINGEYSKKANKDLWLQVNKVWSKVNCRTKVRWVRGHDGNKWNEHVDKLCSKAYKTNK